MVRDKVETAKVEILQLFELLFNEQDNMDEILSMLKEGAEAGYAGYKLFKELHGEDNFMAAWDIGDSIQDMVRQKYLKYSDED